MSAPPADLDAVARDLLGFDLRPGQREAVDAALRGDDVLAVMPTGSGKSAIYQLVGAMVEGVTVVVSPLIALQHDQVAHIGDDLGGAVQLNSSLGAREREATLERMRSGAVEFVFVAPEQLGNEEARAGLRAARPTVFVVDEAHCISTMGHDFRPAYRQLGPLIAELGHPLVIALTATAAPPVQADIIDQLGMDDPAVVVTGFERPNLHLAVEPGGDDPTGRLVELVGGLEGTGIVYVSTRAAADDLAEVLSTPDRPALAYHAGLSASQRAGVHERFGADDPSVVVATTAFGMGIDVPHVRFVVHLGAPESLDAYLQEVGRAGRDGRPAWAVLVEDERGGRDRFAGVSEIPESEVATVIDVVAPVDGELPLPVLRELVDLPDTRLAQVAELLSEVGAVELDADSVRWRPGTDREDAAARAHELRERARTVDRTRRDMVDQLLTTSTCRWQLLLGYFGQPTESACGHCDRCDAGTGDPQVASANRGDGPFPLDARVVHPEFGAGSVIGRDDDTVTVLFDDAGYRTLGVDLVLERDLLRPA